MFFNKRENYGIYASVEGIYVPQEKLSDTTFSSGLMGPGYGILPETTDVLSPMSGVVSMVFPTGHAVGLTREDGMELLIHIGVDTVNLNGAGFHVHVKQGSKVKQGDILVSFDKDMIVSKQLDPTVIHVFTNADKYMISFKSDLHHVKVGDSIADVGKK